MSGFSPEWLALREPADIAARNRRVMDSCRHVFTGRSDVVVCDMGAGTGASVRAFADLLPRRQDWILIDHDQRNLSAATAALDMWKGAREIRIQTMQRDFAQDAACWPEHTDLVSASALLDLCSRAWIDDFVAALAARRLPLLATLTVNGIMATAPAHELNEPIFAAFRDHQTGDKGFGPSAGAEAAVYLERCLTNAGYKIEAGESPWLIDRSSPALMNELLIGIAGAARAIGKLNTTDVDTWLRANAAHIQTLTIGHRDVFAWLE
jgi:trans-aconitate methyltransferase